MPEKKIKNNIFYVGAVDKDRRIFDQLVPLPDGTTYNSYIIIGSEKIALIDTVDASMPEVILKNLVMSLYTNFQQSYPVLFLGLQEEHQRL